MRAMARVDNPPFGRKPQDLQVQVHDGSRPVSDFPGIEDKRKRDAAQAELARDELARKTAGEHVLFDAAVAAEATRRHRKLSISTEFANDVKPGLKKQGIVAGRFKILAAVNRLKGRPTKK
jgi:predicted GTPase